MSALSSIIFTRHVPQAGDPNNGEPACAACFRTVSELQGNGELWSHRANQVPHFMCTGCLQNWIGRRGSDAACPVCREPLDSRSHIRWIRASMDRFTGPLVRAVAGSTFGAGIAGVLVSSASFNALKSFVIGISIGCVAGPLLLPIFEKMAVRCCRWIGQCLQSREPLEADELLLEGV